MSAGCVALPLSTLYTTPTVTYWQYNYTTTTYTVPAVTETAVEYTTKCYRPNDARRAGELDPRQLHCEYGTYIESWTTTRTYPGYTTEYVWLNESLTTVTLPPEPIETIYGSSCTTNPSSSSSTSVNSTSSSSIIYDPSSSSTSTSTSTNSSTIISTLTSSNITSSSSTRSSSSTSIRTLTSSISPPSRSSSRTTSRTTSPITHTHTSFTHISTRTRPSASPHSSLPRETQSPSRSRTRTRLTVSHASSSRPITHTVSSSAPRSTVSPISMPTLPVSSRPSLRLTSVPTQATSRTRVSEISQVTRTPRSSELTRATRTRPSTGTITDSDASESANFETALAETAEATTDGSQVFQPYILTRSIKFDSETDGRPQTQRTRTHARPQTRTVAQAAATETDDDDDETPAAHTRPGTAHHTPHATHDRTREHETADRSDRPDDVAQQTHRETNANTPQRTPPATNRVTPQPSRTLPQVTTAQPSSPAGTSAAQTPATTSGGIINTNQTTDEERRKPNVGAIVGATIGTLAFLAFLGVVASKYIKAHSPSGGERGREEEATAAQSLMGDFFQQGFGGAAGGVGGQGAGSGKGGPGNKLTGGPGGSGSGADAPYDPEMSEVYNNAPPTGADGLGPHSHHPQTGGPSTFGDNGAYSTQGPSGHPFSGYGAGAGGAEGVAHGHGAGGGGYGNVGPNAGGGAGGSYGNVAPGGGGGGAGGPGNAFAPADGGGGFGNAGGGGGGGAANGPTAPPGSGSGSGPFGADISNHGLNPTHGGLPPGGGDIPASGGGGHHGPGFIPIIVPIGARKRPAASQTSLTNTLPTPYLMTGPATYDARGYPTGAAAASSTSLMGGGNYSGNERSSTDGNSRYSLSDGLYGQPAYGRYEDPFEAEERFGLLPSYESRPGTSGATRRNEKNYR